MDVCIKCGRFRVENNYQYLNTHSYFFGLAKQRCDHWWARMKKEDSETIINIGFKYRGKIDWVINMEKR